MVKPKKRHRGRPPSGRISVTLKLTPEIDDQVWEAAAQEGITKSEFVEKAIQRELAAGSRR